MNAMEQAMEYIRLYYKENFALDVKSVEKRFANLSVVPLASMDYPAESVDSPIDIKISVFADLFTYSITRYVNGMILEKEKFSSLSEMADKRLQNLSYESLIALPVIPNYSFMGCVHLLRELIKCSEFAHDPADKTKIIVTSLYGYKSQTIMEAATDLTKNTTRQIVWSHRLEMARNNLPL